MDIFDVLLQIGLITCTIVFYLILFRKKPTNKGHYSEQGWNYYLKAIWARYATSRWKSSRATPVADELPREDLVEGWDQVTLRSTAQDGTIVLLGIRKLCGRQDVAEITLYVELPDGSRYALQRHPDTLIGGWVDTEDGWNAGGLKIQVIQPMVRLRVLYNGLVTKLNDGSVTHATINLIWASASPPFHHPDDWSTRMAAQLIAYEPWRDDEWVSMLDRWEDGGWLQYGAMQGRFQTYDLDGAVVDSAWLRVRGTKERSWAPHGYLGLRRMVSLMIAAEDGTVVQLKALSYKDKLKQVLSGSVRYPNYNVESIDSTDFSLENFGEFKGSLPDCYTMNISTKNRNVKIVFRIHHDSGTLFSGIPYQQEVQYQTVSGSIDGFQATGILELGQEPKETREPQVSLTPAPQLVWLPLEAISSPGYCVPFEARAATCPDLVGGKGASLALLASVQKTEGYVVPPGYCLTTLAFEKQLDCHPEILKAIYEIEEANTNYDEQNFRDKCIKASTLIRSTEIVDQVKEEILANLKDLRKKAIEQNLGPELKFAVRSSGVGEDGTALSAAGQNDTVLGCSSDEDVLRAVTKCWASMYAFTSAHYRRTNGQPCRSSGGVVVQTLIPARSAGVMFTRTPATADPRVALITANYGLGETVVSGSVEPDTFLISRDGEKLSIHTVELGSKSTRMTTLATGLTSQDVPENERNVACVSEAEVLKLAKIGIAQEVLWGAPRDIEWAVVDDTIYLLQARPITSLERWTEEDLLHELDSPIMADVTLTTFANVGEVMPKPISPLTHDLVIKSLSDSMARIFSGDFKEYNYKETCGVTHARFYIDCYNVTYCRVPHQLDIGMRMMEMAVHGHTVADQTILKHAQHRHPPAKKAVFKMYHLMIKSLVLSKWYANKMRNEVNALNFETKTEDIGSLLNSLTGSINSLRNFNWYHLMTSSASSASQIIAMSVLLEGGQDFTPEQCNEIGAMLSSGDAVSAEVPRGLARLAAAINKSNLADEFRKLELNEALTWLQKNMPNVFTDVTEFLGHHGHRALMEFDLATKPWVLVPEQLLKVLQNIKETMPETNSVTSDDELIASLKTPKKPFTRKALQYILPLCRRMVVNRESTKANLILSVHKLRLVCLQLGQVLVKRWMLPDPDLVFYFRMYELKAYIKTRDPVLLRKAVQRHRLMPGWARLQFPELSTGWPQPLHREPHVAAVAVLRATPVCAGDVVARAAVITDLSQIGDLKQGDVLITHSTDIGWSPYFPLISGIVTELGGLISHGAVIAREYGLPCIVGASGATDMFQTGDIVRLSGQTGVLEKIEVTKVDEEVSKLVSL